MSVVGSVIAFLVSIASGLCVLVIASVLRTINRLVTRWTLNQFPGVKRAYKLLRDEKYYRGIETRLSKERAKESNSPCVDDLRVRLFDDEIQKVVGQAGEAEVDFGRCSDFERWAASMLPVKWEDLEGR